MLLQKIANWFYLAKPTPNAKDCQVQLGVHIEEFSEMLEALLPITKDIPNYTQWLNDTKTMAEYFKKSKASLNFDDKNLDHIALLDSLTDQVVTTTGLARLLNYQFIPALEDVNESNYSKFEDGKPVLNNNGKIIKGKNYRPPNLKSFALCRTLTGLEELTEGFMFNDRDDCFLFETFGEDLEKVLEKEKERRVLTVITGSNDEDVVVGGFHICNRINYIITNKPIPEQLNLDSICVPYRS